MPKKLDSSTERTLVVVSPRVHVRLGSRGTVVLVGFVLATVVAMLAGVVWLAPFGVFQGTLDPTMARWLTAGALVVGLICGLWMLAGQRSEE